MSIADGTHDLEIVYAGPDRDFTETWTVSCSDLPNEEMAKFLMAVASGHVQYRKTVAETDHWLGWPDRLVATAE